MQDRLAIFPSSVPLRSPLALDLSWEEWRAWCIASALPIFRAKQIYQWLYQECVTDPSRWTNLPLALRNRLLDEFSWEPWRVDSRLLSCDGSEKVLLKTQEGLLVEIVLMPYAGRTTLCISSQVGCKMGCTFCQTGKMGLTRNLTSGEILGQVTLANQLLKEVGSLCITNVVFMGMGEPLDNYEEVVKACRILIDKEAFALSLSRVTISTSGLVPEILRLGQELPLRLAISLHSANDARRSKMMPVNRRYPLSVLKEALLQYPASARDGITFEYVMIEGENDSLEDAKGLVAFLHGIKAKVNLIPVNHFPGMTMRASAEEAIRCFQLYLKERSIPAPVRYSRGQDVSGGCGQLAAKREQELGLDPRVLHRSRRLSERATP